MKFITDFYGKIIITVMESEPMILRLTQMARDKIKLPNKALVISFERTKFLDEWYVNIFNLNYKKYFILTESKSLYSIVVDSKGINSVDSFELMFFGFVNTQIIKIDKEYRIKKLESLKYCKTENKRVLGSQVDLIYMAKARNWDNASYDFEVINETPMSFLDFDNPKRVFIDNIWKSKNEET